MGLFGGLNGNHFKNAWHDILYKYYYSCLNFLLYTAIEKALDVYFSQCWQWFLLNAKIVNDFQVAFFLALFVYPHLFSYIQKCTVWKKNEGKRERGRGRRIPACFCPTKFCFYK